MAKSPGDFAQQNTERAVQATNYGMNWMREIAEQNLTQSKAALEGLLMITRARPSMAWMSKHRRSASAPCSWPKKRSPTRSTLFRSSFA